MGYQITDIQELSDWMQYLNNGKTYDNNIIKYDAFKLLSIMINNGKLDKFTFKKLIFKKNTNTINFFQQTPTKNMYLLCLYLFLFN